MVKDAGRPGRTFLAARRFRLWLCILVIVGCGGSARSGEKGALEFHFGLGGCSSVSAANATLAKGSSTDLIVTDGTSSKRSQLTVESGSPGVIELPGETFDLACKGNECAQTEGRLALAARNTGTARIGFSSGGTASWE